MADQAYEAGRALAAKKWERAQRIAGQRLRREQERYASMPDVANRPAKDKAWSHEGIVCGCGNAMFYPKRWATINGLRYRAELHCTVCSRARTWEWATMSWAD